MTTENFKTLFICKTVYNADSVEWCPISPYQNCFVCGTYQQVDEGDNCKGNKRKGTISLFTMTNDELKETMCIETSAVLDMKWCSNTLADNIALGVANADGEICVYFLSFGCLKYVTKCCLKKSDEDFLMLSLDWSKNPCNDLICASDSKGNITILKFLDEDLIVLKEWNAHSQEAWITCFDPLNSNLIFTGGDDAKLNVWDTRTENESKIGRSNRHTAGVTVLARRPATEYCLASGSYDETILLWDTRNWKEPTHQISTSGGLWRLKWKPEQESSHLLAACIYGGFEIIKPFESLTVGQYKEHESLAYGTDWSYLRESEFFSDDQYLIATCSFYDQKLCVSLWDENKTIVDGF